MSYDLVIAGGGPAGLALAIASAIEGLRVTVLERRAPPVDKACGEGLLPPALQALKQLDVLRLIDDAECAPIAGVRYLDGDLLVEGRLPEPGLGVRRPALIDALRRRAVEVGVELRDRCAWLGHRRVNDAVLVDSDQGTLRARLLVAADGLGSPLRHAEGLDLPPSPRPRLGLRRHFRLAPWSRMVEVHFAQGVEAYVTPAGRRRVGVAFLWERDKLPHHSFAGLLANFPRLAARLDGAAADSTTRGAGPLEQRARARIADRFLLIGDAAGYLDAISGEGLSLAFGCAVELAPRLPQALAEGATRGALAFYEGIFARHFRHYARLTRALLLLARRPRLRRSLLKALAARPPWFEALMAWAVAPNVYLRQPAAFSI